MFLVFFVVVGISVNLLLSFEFLLLWCQVSKHFKQTATVAKEHRKPSNEIELKCKYWFSTRIFNEMEVERGKKNENKQPRADWALIDKDDEWNVENEM